MRRINGMKPSHYRAYRIKNAGVFRRSELIKLVQVIGSKQTARVLGLSHKFVKKMWRYRGVGRRRAVIVSDTTPYESRTVRQYHGAETGRFMNRSSPFDVPRGSRG